MKTAWILAAAALVGPASSLAFLGACAATDDDGTPGDPPGSNTVPAADGGVEASLEDAGASDDPCTPDALCPTGPFAADTPGGAFDGRTRINVIRGRSANDVWAAGARGAIAHFDGTTWRRSDVGSKASMNAFWLRDSGEVGLSSLFAIYSRGVVQSPSADAGPPSADGWLYDGAAEVPAELQTTSRLTSVWSFPGSEWAFCSSLEPGLGDTVLGDANANGIWRLRYVPSAKAFEVVHAFAPGTCSVLGCRQMTSIHGISADDFWAVGYTGAAIHVTNALSDSPTVVAFDSETWAGFGGVWVASADDVWAVGGAGTIRHYTGKPYTLDVVAGVPATEDLNAVWGTSPSDIWAVGDAATVLHYDGTAWSRVKVVGFGARRPDLFAVWASAPGHVWIGGDGVILSLGGKP